MEENRKNPAPERDHYQTGSTQPPKSHSMLVTWLLVLVVLLTGVVSILGIQNIRLLDALNSANLSSIHDPASTNPTTATSGNFAGQPALGIEGEQVDTVSQHYYNIPAGIYITGISPELQRCGLRTGDILLTVNGQRITTMQELKESVAACRIGQTAAVTVYREKGRHSLNLPITEEAP